MVYFSFLAASTLAATALSAAIPETKPGFLKLAFEVERGPDVPPSISKRDNGPITQTLINKNVFYLTYVYAGSNKQKIGVDIDTGSSDLWFVDKDVRSTRVGTALTIQARHLQPTISFRLFQLDMVISLEPREHIIPTILPLDPQTLPMF